MEDDFVRFKEAKQRVVNSFEINYLTALLHRAGGVSAAARLSGINRPHLHRLLKKHGLIARRTGDGAPAVGPES
jgi:transcriptional regulator of acetoin/glycerol metabolism